MWLTPSGRNRRPAPVAVQQREHVARADLLGHGGAVARDQRGLERLHAAHVLEALERGLDEAVDVAADGDVVVAAGLAMDAVDVLSEDLERLLERLRLL